MCWCSGIYDISPVYILSSQRLTKFRGHTSFSLSSEICNGRWLLSLAWHSSEIYPIYRYLRRGWQKPNSHICHLELCLSRHFPQFLNPLNPSRYAWSEYARENAILIKQLQISCTSETERRLDVDYLDSDKSSIYFIHAQHSSLVSNRRMLCTYSTETFSNWYQVQPHLLIFNVGDP